MFSFFTLQYKLIFFHETARWESSRGHGVQGFFGIVVYPPQDSPPGAAFYPSSGMEGQSPDYM
jgi:hypothetical protein